MTARIDERLFPVVNNVPDGCTLHLIPDGAHEPYLRCGEWAVVDKGQREIENGAVYLIRQNAGPRIWRVRPTGWKVKSDKPHYDLSPMRRQDFDKFVDAPMIETPFGRLPQIFVSDGPVEESYLKERIIGKVIGVYVSRAEETTAPVR